MSKQLRWIVEDSENDALLLLRELRRGGYEPVFERVDSAEGLAQALEKPWEIVISDYVMPNFGGLEALKMAQAADPDRPFIIVSGNIGEDIAVGAMKAGANDYIMKSNLKRLVATIERELREADNRRRRREAEQALRRSEASLAEAQRIAHTGSWDWDLSGCFQVSDEMYRILGSNGESEISLDMMLERVHPEDRAAVEKAMNGAVRHGRSFDIDHRIVLPDGTTRAVHNRTQVSVDDAGVLVRMFGTLQDVTERRQTEDTLRALSHRLVTLQEEQSRTVARELHDQFGQTLTVLTIVLDRVKKVPPQKVGALLDESRGLIDDLFKRVHDLSLNLRPAMLDDLGLLPTLVWHIERCREQTQLKIHFTHHGLERGFSSDVSTVAYRIVQETLTNILRHSGTDEASVAVWAADDRLYIRVEDSGAGFDASSVGSRERTGLTGMKERASWLGGTVEIESMPGRGTIVKAEIPANGQGHQGGRYDHNIASRRPSNREARSTDLARNGA